MGSDAETDRKKEKRKLLAISPISRPLAHKKLCKRTLKIVRRASEMKQLKRGVKEVVKSIRRDDLGIKLDTSRCILTSCTRSSSSSLLVLIDLRRLDVLQQMQQNRHIFFFQSSLCVIAGDISPIDVITHVPVLCEEADVPYIYVPSKEELASAGTTKRPTCCVLILTEPQKGDVNIEDKENFKEDFDDIVKEVKSLTASFF